MVNEMQAEGTWDTIVGKLKQVYGKITDQEWEYGAKGKWDELTGAFKKGYGDSEEAMNDFDNHTAPFRSKQDGESCGTGCGCSGKNAA